MVAFFVFLAAEAVSYLWHRFVAHRSLIATLLPLEEVSVTHRGHHRASFEDDDASQDFIWIVLVLIITVLITVLLYKSGYLHFIPRGVLVTCLLTFVFFFLLSWYVHRSVHVESTWIYHTSLMEDIRRIHRVHHENPLVNYSILNLSDDIMGTRGY